MFHIKTDKRSQRSARLILEALVTCLKRKPFEEITVSDLQRESGVSRATFYRLFDNLFDVLAYQCEVLTAALVRKYREDAGETGFLPFSLAFWLENHMFLEAVFASGRGDILQSALRRHSDALLESFQLPAIPADEMDYFTSTVTAILSSVLMVWVRHGKRESAGELHQTYSRMMRLTGELLL